VVAGANSCNGEPPNDNLQLPSALAGGPAKKISGFSHKREGQHSIRPFLPFISVIDDSAYIILMKVVARVCLYRK